MITNRRGWLVPALIVLAVLLAAALTSGKSGLKMAAAVGACGLMVWAAYFAGYQKPDWSPDYLGRGAGYSAGYFFASVGGFAAARYADLLRTDARILVSADPQAAEALRLCVPEGVQCRDLFVMLNDRV